MSGKAQKSNVGGMIQNMESRVKAGSPNMSQLRTIGGTIIDILYPDDINENRSQGAILVRILFDDKNYASDNFLNLKDSYSNVLALYGTRESVIREKPRVRFTFRDGRFNDGYAEIISDNKDVGKFEKYARNKSAVYANIFSNIGLRTRPIGG